MKKINWYIFLTATTLILELLNVFVPLPLVLIAVIAIGSFESLKTASFFAFVGGLITDTASGRTLGLGSLFYLAVVFVIYLYRQKLRQESTGFLIILTFIFSQVYLFVFQKYGYFYPVEGLVSAILSIPLTSFLYHIKSKDSFL